MPLKYKVKSKEEVPAELSHLYQERDGAWLLDVEGAIDKAKLEEIRNNNATLARERDELKQRFEGIDPDEVRKLMEEKQRLEMEAQGKKPEDIDRILAERVKTLRADLEKQIGSLTSERDTLNSRLTTIQIDQGVVTAATRLGLRSAAIPDITSRARAVFRLVNGAPTAFESDGKTIRYGRDGISPMTVEEWIGSVKIDAPHLFTFAEHGLQPGGDGENKTALGKNNPFSRKSWNLTEQMRLYKSDPANAQRLESAARETN